MVGRISFRLLALPSFLREPFLLSTHQVIGNQTGIITRSGLCATLSTHFKYCFLFIVVLILLVALTYFTVGYKKYHSSHHRRFNLAVSAGHGLNSNYYYGIVIDCGSSGSRAYLYYWPPHNGNPEELLQIKQLKDSHGNPVSKKIKPGISTYSEKPFNSSEYLEPLLDFAASHIPKDKHKETPLYVLATAGMRLLSIKQQEAIIKDLTNDIPSKYEFHFTSSHAEVITGKQEGIYSWIGVNFVLGRFDHSHAQQENPTTLSSSEVPRKATVGALDMGGASAQIAFEVQKSTYVPSDLLAEVNLGCDSHQTIHNYRVYVATFLGFGGNAARERYVDLVLTNRAQHYDQTLGAYIDPCLPLDYQEESTNRGRKYHFIGTGDFLQCQKTIFPLLNTSVRCPKPPCSFNGVYQPINTNKEFYGFSEYWYSMHDVLRIGGHYQADRMAKAAKDFCSTRWNVLKRRQTNGLYPFADNHRLRYQCFKSAWMTTMLHQGFRFSFDYNGLYSAQFIEDKEVQWTLGAILYRTRFLPLREIQHNHLHSQYSSSKSSYYFLTSFASEVEFRVVFLFCSVIVLTAIVLFFRRLRRMSGKSSHSLLLWSRPSSKSAVFSMKLIPSNENIPV